MTGLVEPLLLGDDFALPLDRPFTRQTAFDAGLTKHRLAALVGCGLLRHPIRNVYVAAQAPDDLTNRARAIALVMPSDGFVCDRSAAWLHGAPAALAPNEHLIVPPVSCFLPSDKGRLRNALAVSGEREIAKGDLMEVEGVVVTTPLRTALDLGRLQRSPDVALAGMDAMLRLGVGHEELLVSVDRFRRRRGVVQLRRLAPIADGGAESHAESALRLRWHGAGLPRPQLQIPVLLDGVVVAYLDMGLEELWFAAEYDGFEWHSRPEDVARDSARRSWLADARHWQVEVFVRANVYGPTQDAEQRLRAAFELARRSLGTRRIFT